MSRARPGVREMPPGAPEPSAEARARAESEVAYRLFKRGVICSKWGVRACPCTEYTVAIREVDLEAGTVVPLCARHVEDYDENRWRPSLGRRWRLGLSAAHLRWLRNGLPPHVNAERRRRQPTPLYEDISLRPSDAQEPPRRPVTLAANGRRGA